MSHWPGLADTVGLKSVESLHSYVQVKFLRGVIEDLWEEFLRVPEGTSIWSWSTVGQHRKLPPDRLPPDRLLYFLSLKHHRGS